MPIFDDLTQSVPGGESLPNPTRSRWRFRPCARFFSSYLRSTGSVAAAAIPLAIVTNGSADYRGQFASDLQQADVSSEVTPATASGILDIDQPPSSTMGHELSGKQVSLSGAGEPLHRPEWPYP